MKSPAWAPGSQRDDTREMREHSVPAAQEISGEAAGARTTWKPALAAGARSPRAPQMRQGRLDQACFTKAKHKGVQPELEGMPKRCHLQSVAANGTALWHVPQPSKGYILQVTLGSICGRPLGHSATYCIAFVPGTTPCLLPTCDTATGTPAHHLSLCQQH